MQAASFIEHARQTNSQMRYGLTSWSSGQAAKAAEIAGQVRLAGGNPALDDWAVVGTLLSNAQTGTGPSTNILDTGPPDFLTSDIMLRLVTTVGATPTVTMAIEGTIDKVTWSPVKYALSTTPDTIVTTTFVTTTAATKIVIIRAGQPYRYLRLNYSANTNVTSTVDAAVL